MTKLESTIARAIDHHNPESAGRVVDNLRALGWNYDQVLAEVQRVRPQVTAGEWDSLLYEADMAAM